MKKFNNFKSNTVFLGDRLEIFASIKEEVKNFFENENVFEKKEIDFFEIEKLNISVDDVRRMISFTNHTSENVKVCLLSSFYWSDEAQNAMLKVLEETPPNTYIYIFGLNEKKFLKTVLSRVQKKTFLNTNRYLKDAEMVLELEPTERLENKVVKKVLSLKTTDYNFEKNLENEKKDREAHILFLYALIDSLLRNREELKLSKSYLDKILKITTLAEIEGGSPHLFVEWLLLSSPKIV